MADPTPEQPTSPPPAPSGEGSQTSPQPDTVPAQQGRPASLKIHDERRDLGIPLEAYKKSAEFKRADAYLGDKFADDKIASHLPKNTGENDDQYRKRKLGEIDKRVRDSEAYSGDDWVKQILMGENHPDLRELARTIEAHFTTMRQEEQQRMIEDLRTQFAENRPNTVLTQVGELGVRDQAEGPYVAYYLDDEGKPREMLREARQDFLAFRLIEDRLADVEDPTLMTAFPEKRYPGVGIVITDIANTLKQEGKPPSYRNMIQSLRERLAKPQSAEDRFTTKLTYAEVRGRFYRNIKEALQHKRNVDTAPAGASTADLSTLTPVALDMADILKEIDFSKPGLETMIDNYQGFNQDIGKQKLQEQMKGEIDALSLHLFLLALKGEERFERGVKTPIKLERNPQVTRKRFIEGGTQEPTGGGRTPTVVKPPTEPTVVTPPPGQKPEIGYWKDSPGWRADADTSAGEKPTPRQPEGIKEEAGTAPPQIGYWKDFGPREPAATTKEPFIRRDMEGIEQEAETITPVKTTTPAPTPPTGQEPTIDLWGESGKPAEGKKLLDETLSPAPPLKVHPPFSGIPPEEIDQRLKDALEKQKAEHPSGLVTEQGQEIPSTIVGEPAAEPTGPMTAEQAADRLGGITPPTTPPEELIIPPGGPGLRERIVHEPRPTEIPKENLDAVVSAHAMENAKLRREAEMQQARDYLENNLRAFAQWQEKTGEKVDIKDFVRDHEADYIRSLDNPEQYVNDRTLLSHDLIANSLVSAKVTPDNPLLKKLQSILSEKDYNTIIKRAFGKEEPLVPRSAGEELITKWLDDYFLREPDKTHRPAPQISPAEIEQRLEAALRLQQAEHPSGLVNEQGQPIPSAEELPQPPTGPMTAEQAADRLGGITRKPQPEIDLWGESGKPAGEIKLPDEDVYKAATGVIPTTIPFTIEPEAVGQPPVVEPKTAEELNYWKDYPGTRAEAGIPTEEESTPRQPEGIEQAELTLPPLPSARPAIPPATSGEPPAAPAAGVVPPADTAGALDRLRERTEQIQTTAGGDLERLNRDMEEAMRRPSSGPPQPATPAATAPVSTVTEPAAETVESTVAAAEPPPATEAAVAPATPPPAEPAAGAAEAVPVTAEAAALTAEQTTRAQELFGQLRDAYREKPMETALETEKRTDELQMQIGKTLGLGEDETIETILQEEERGMLLGFRFKAGTILGAIIGLEGITPAQIFPESEKLQTVFQELKDADRAYRTGSIADVTNEARYNQANAAFFTTLDDVLGIDKDETNRLSSDANLRVVNFQSLLKRISEESIPEAQILDLSRDFAEKNRKMIIYQRATNSWAQKELELLLGAAQRAGLEISRIIYLEPLQRVGVAIPTEALEAAVPVAPGAAEAPPATPSSPPSPRRPFAGMGERLAQARKTAGERWESLRAQVPKPSFGRREKPPTPFEEELRAAEPLIAQLKQTYMRGAADTADVLESTLAEQLNHPEEARRTTIQQEQENKSVIASRLPYNTADYFATWDLVYHQQLLAQRVFNNTPLQNAFQKACTAYDTYLQSKKNDRDYNKRDQAFDAFTGLFDSQAGIDSRDRGQIDKLRKTLKEKNTTFAKLITQLKEGKSVSDTLFLDALLARNQAEVTHLRAVNNVAEKRADYFGKLAEAAEVEIVNGILNEKTQAPPLPEPSAPTAPAAPAPATTETPAPRATPTAEIPASLLSSVRHEVGLTNVEINRLGEELKTAYYGDPSLATVDKGTLRSILELSSNSLRTIQQAREAEEVSDPNRRIMFSGDRTKVEALETFFAEAGIQEPKVRARQIYVMFASGSQAGFPHRLDEYIGSRQGELLAIIKSVELLERAKSTAQ